MVKVVGLVKEEHQVHQVPLLRIKLVWVDRSLNNRGLILFPPFVGCAWFMGVGSLKLFGQVLKHLRILLPNLDLPRFRMHALILINQSRFQVIILADWGRKLRTEVLILRDIDTQTLVLNYLKSTYLPLTALFLAGQRDCRRLCVKQIVGGDCSCWSINSNN